MQGSVHGSRYLAGTPVVWAAKVRECTALPAALEPLGIGVDMAQLANRLCAGAVTAPSAHIACLPFCANLAYRAAWAGTKRETLLVQQLMASAAHIRTSGQILVAPAHVAKAARWLGWTSQLGLARDGAAANAYTPALLGRSREPAVATQAHP